MQLWNLNEIYSLPSNLRLAESNLTRIFLNLIVTKIENIGWKKVNAIFFQNYSAIRKLEIDAYITYWLKPPVNPSDNHMHDKSNNIVIVKEFRLISHIFVDLPWNKFSSLFLRVFQVSTLFVVLYYALSNNFNCWCLERQFN